MPQSIKPGLQPIKIQPSSTSGGLFGSGEYNYTESTNTNTSPMLTSPDSGGWNRQAIQQQISDMAKNTIPSSGDQRIERMQNVPNYYQQEQARQQQQQTIQYLMDQMRTGGQQQAARDQQRQYAETLLNQAKGIGGPTAAQSQLQAALQKQQAQAASQAASIRGMNPVAAARLVAQQQAENTQQAANQSATLRAQEMQSAQEQYAKVLAETRQADIDAQYKQSVVLQQMQEMLRTGDQNAISAAMNAAVNMRAQNMQYMTAKERNEYDARVQAANNQLQVDLQKNQQDYNKGIINDQTKKENDAKAFAMWMGIIAGGLVAGAGATLIATGVAAPIGAAMIPAGLGIAGSAINSGANVSSAAAAGMQAQQQQDNNKQQTQNKSEQKPESSPEYVASGGLIKGKASKPGDSEDNDTVPALLSPGEIVIPRSIALSKDADKRSAEFVRQLKKIESSRPNSKHSAMDKIAKLEAQIAALKSKSAKSRK